MRTFWLLVLLAFAPVALPVSADETEASKKNKSPAERARAFDNAIVGDTATIVEEGEVLVTLGGSYDNGDHEESGSIYVDVELGVSDTVEVSFNVPYEFFREDEMAEQHMGDVSVAVTKELIDEDNYTISGALSLSLPTNNEAEDPDDPHQDEVELSPSLFASLSVGDAEIVAAGGVSYSRKETSNWYSLTLAYDFDRVFHSIGIEGSSDGEENELFVTPGVGFSFGEYDIAIELPLGVTKESSDWGVALELSVEF